MHHHVSKLDSQNTSRKKISLVITELEVGGAEKTLVELASRLDQQKFEVTVIAIASRPSISNDLLIKKLESNRITPIFLNCDHSWQFFSAIRRLKTLWKENPPDLIHSFLFHANIISSWAKKVVPRAGLIHGLRVQEQGYLRQIFQGYFGKHADKVCCVSQRLEQFAREKLGIPAHNLCVIPNGIDFENFQQVLDQTAERPDEMQDNSKKYLLCVGRLDPQKGFDWLLKAIPTLQNDLQAWQVLIAGEGPQRSQLEELIRNLKLNHIVRLLGQRADVPSLLKYADLFVLPSRWEGMANALLEAMTAGLPVLATDVEGTKEALGDNQQGQLIQFGEDTQLQNDLKKLVQNPNLRIELGKKNREQIQVNFSLESCIKQYESLYLNILKRKT